MVGSSVQRDEGVIKRWAPRDKLASEQTCLTARDRLSPQDASVARLRNVGRTNDHLIGGVGLDLQVWICSGIRRRQGLRSPAAWSVVGVSAIGISSYGLRLGHDVGTSSLECFERVVEGVASAGSRVRRRNGIPRLGCRRCTGVTIGPLGTEGNRGQRHRSAGAAVTRAGFRTRPCGRRRRLASPAPPWHIGSTVGCPVAAASTLGTSTAFSVFRRQSGVRLTSVPVLGLPRCSCSSVCPWPNARPWPFVPPPRPLGSGGSPV